MRQLYTGIDLRSNNNHVGGLDQKMKVSPISHQILDDCRTPAYNV